MAMVTFIASDAGVSKSILLTYPLPIKATPAKDAALDTNIKQFIENAKAG